MSERFRGFLPVVVDVETGGFNSKTDALLEIAAVFVDFGDGGILTRGETIRYHVKPFEGANMEIKSDQKISRPKCRKFLSLGNISGVFPVSSLGTPLSEIID